MRGPTNLKRKHWEGVGCWCWGRSGTVWTNITSAVQGVGNDSSSVSGWQSCFKLVSVCGSVVFACQKTAPRRWLVMCDEDSRCFATAPRAGRSEQTGWQGNDLRIFFPLREPSAQESVNRKRLRCCAGFAQPSCQGAALVRNRAQVAQDWTRDVFSRS
jgi:hypothetical protein